MRRATLAFLMVVSVGGLGCKRYRSTCEHYQHKGFNPMPQKAIDACTKVCEEDADADACGSVSGWYRERGELERARDFDQKACELGKDAEVCADERARSTKIANEVRAYNEEMDAERKRLRACGDDPSACERGCERGELSACVQLGDMYALGLGRTADPERAHELFAKACELHDDTRYCWSNIYVNSYSCAVPDNRPPCDEELDGGCPGPPRPLEGCEKVGIQRDMSAATHLAMCNGQRACDQVLERSCRLDVQACERACEDNDDAARCRQLGIMHETGAGVPERNPAKAERYAKRACELGDTHSCEPKTRDTRKLAPKPL